MMKKILTDKKVIALVIILLVFSIGYFIIVNKISYAFTSNNRDETSNKTIETIKMSAESYGKSNVNIFDENKIAYIKVQDLIDNSLLATDENGLIINSQNNESLNSKVIKLKLENDQIVVEIDS